MGFLKDRLTRGAAGLLLLMFVGLLGTESVHAAEYEVAAPPSWVQPLSAESTDGVPKQTAGSTEYVLVDRQIRVEDGWSEYGRYVSRVVNAAGTEDASQLTIDFDPERDRLRVHAVTLRRGGEVIDELQQGRIEILRRESQLERGTLDGRLTFHLLMTDVRVGDTIDFSYTLQHHEPVFGDRFFARRTTQWDVAVQRSRLRVSTPVTRPVHIAGSESSQPVRSQQGDWETLEWNWSGLPEVSPDPDSPSWYEQHPSIQFSQFADWQEVAQAIMPLFSADAHDADVIAEAQRLKSNTKSDAERVLAVLRFVQEEVRYTGLELGSGAYRPRAPGEVLRRRYGDCKDKVLLAITLLRSLGIKAEPALVSTRWQRHLHERFPSPGDFDHVIVKVLLSGKSYWVDVTETAQGGRLDTFEQADLGDALVLSPGVRQLEQMPSALARQPLIAATGLFDLRSGEDAEGKFTLSTVYRGSEADDMRRKLRRTTAADLGTTYLNYYKNRYPEVRAVHAPEFHDDPVLNEITVNESYLIPHPFGTSTDKQRFEIEAEAVNDFLRAPSRPARNAPLWLPYPSNVSEQITIRLPSYFPVKDDVVQIEDPTFRYESRLTHSGNDVSLECHYQTRTDEVARDRLEEFLKNREKARQDNTLSFTSSPRDTDEKAAAAALKELAKAAELGKAGKFADGDAVLSRMIDSTGFQALTDIQRHSALYLGAALAGAHADYPRSLDLLKRSCAMEEAEAADWELRVRIAHAGHQVADAALALTVLAQRWPNNLTNLDFPTIGRILHDLPEAGSGRYPLLTALRESKYIPEGGDLSAWWRDLALLQLERGETDKARSTLDGITDPYAVISVRADRRFEDVRPKNLPDVGEALELQIRKTKEVIALHPDKLDPIVQLTYLLRYSLRYDEVLKVTDDVLAVVNGPNGRKAYKDFDRYIWILDNRSNAFYGLGRWDEAVAQMVSASHLPESSQDNVSQVINLAGLYNDLGRPEQARATLSALRLENMSPYGRMQAAIELLSAADQLGDPAESERQLSYIREHRADSVATYQRALISANRLDDAARLLIARLQDPAERIGVLMQVQDYKSHPRPKRAEEFHRRWQTVLEREDVRDAINRVGSVNSYPVSDAAY